MIDIHCHIIPGVDDGPSSVEEAEKMIDIMYEDGIKSAVATSHRNHPLNFKPTQKYETALEYMQNYARKRYPGFEIYKGAEFYVRDGYLDLIDSLDYDLRLNGTKYVLIEFDRDASCDYISEAVYEFSIRGYRVVLAHIERYKSLVDNPENVVKLRSEGAYIQITGSTLIGKYGKHIKKRMRRLLRRGYVDFVASDGHSPEKRRPLLKRAYRAVERECGRSEADRLLKKNPAMLVSGGVVRREEAGRNFLSIFFRLKAVHISLLMFFLVGIVTVWFFGF